MAKFEDFLMAAEKKTEDSTVKQKQKVSIPKNLKNSENTLFDNNFSDNKNIASRNIARMKGAVSGVISSLAGGVITGAAGGILGISENEKKYNELQKNMFNKLKNGQSLESIHKELIQISKIAGADYAFQGSIYEGIYVIDNNELRSKILEKGDNYYANYINTRVNACNSCNSYWY